MSQESPAVPSASPPAERSTLDEVALKIGTIVLFICGILTIAMIVMTVWALAKIDAKPDSVREFAGAIIVFLTTASLPVCGVTGVAVMISRVASRRYGTIAAKRGFRRGVCGLVIVLVTCVVCVWLVASRGL